MFIFSPRMHLPDSNKYVNVKFAFQVRIHPDRFEAGPQTIGETDPIDFPLDNEMIEWSTKAKSAIIPVALLVLIESSPG